MTEEDRIQIALGLKYSYTLCIEQKMPYDREWVWWTSEVIVDINLRAAIKQIMDKCDTKVYHEFGPLVNDHLRIVQRKNVYERLFTECWGIAAIHNIQYMITGVQNID